MNSSAFEFGGSQGIEFCNKRGKSLSSLDAAISLAESNSQTQRNV